MVDFNFNHLSNIINMNIERFEYPRNQGTELEIYWVFTCDCDHQIIWGAWADASFWERRSKWRLWSVRTCKCQTKYELNAFTNETTETV